MPEQTKGTNMLKITTAPVNAVAATGVFTITNTVSDGETVTIGSRVYEFKTSGDATLGNIKVDISGGATNALSATALITAIGTTDPLVTATTGGTGIVDVTARVKGVIGNTIVSIADLANGSWGDDTLAAGVDGTVVGSAGLWFIDGSYAYVTTDANTATDANWRKITHASL